jgi:hypothetical protein
MRTRGKIDANQLQIVRALRHAGVSVQSLADLGSGCPDLLCGFRGENWLLEVKDAMLPASRRKLTEDEETWHKLWRGQVCVVESIEDAWRALGLIRKIPNVS